jgi:hypothetical protein
MFVGAIKHLYNAVLYYLCLSIVLDLQLFINECWINYIRSLKEGKRIFFDKALILRICGDQDITVLSSAMDNL